MRTLEEIVGYLMWYGLMITWLAVMFSLLVACVGAPIALGVKLWRAIQAPASPPPRSVSVAEPFAVGSAP